MILFKHEKIFRASGWVSTLIASKPDDWLRSGALDDLNNKEWRYYFDVVNHPAAAYVIVRKVAEDHVVHQMEVPVSQIRSVINNLPIYKNWKKEIDGFLDFVEQGHYDPVH